MDESTLDYYENHVAELAERYDSADMEQPHKQLLTIFAPGAKLLEIGCGSGRDAAFLLAKKRNIQCIEPSRQMIQETLQRRPELGGRLFAGSVPGNLPENLYRPRYYDGVYAMAVLMHLKQEALAPTFSLFYTLIKPQGRLFFSVPLGRPDLKKSGYDPQGRYFLLLPEKDWVSMAEAAGFTGIKTTKNSDGLGRGAITWLTCTGEK